MGQLKTYGLAMVLEDYENTLFNTSFGRRGNGGPNKLSDLEQIWGHILEPQWANFLRILDSPHLVYSQVSSKHHPHTITSFEGRTKMGKPTPGSGIQKMRAVFPAPQKERRVREPVGRVRTELRMKHNYLLPTQQGTEPPVLQAKCVIVS